jgi:dihydrodipicolinate synthase/N-acetylneuraminate lyase
MLSIIIPPPVTSSREDGSVDEQANRAEVRRRVEMARAHGLAVCDSTGEGHTLTTEEKRRCGSVEDVRGPSALDRRDHRQ